MTDHSKSLAKVVELMEKYQVKMVLNEGRIENMHDVYENFPEIASSYEALVDENERLKKHLDDTRKMLRIECEELGDNDWDDNLHLADVVGKHLARQARQTLYDAKKMKESLERWRAQSKAVDQVTREEVGCVKVTTEAIDHVIASLSTNYLDEYVR